MTFETDVLIVGAGPAARPKRVHRSARIAARAPGRVPA
jgi:hypothetical protein